MKSSAGPPPQEKAFRILSLDHLELIRLRCQEAKKYQLEKQQLSTSNSHLNMLSASTSSLKSPNSLGSLKSPNSPNTPNSKQLVPHPVEKISSVHQPARPGWPSAMELERRRYGLLGDSSLYTKRGNNKRQLGLFSPDGSTVCSQKSR